MNLLFLDVPWWLLVLGIIVGYYFFSSRHYGYWTSVGVPHNKPLPFIGSFPISILTGSKSMTELQLEDVKRLGKIRGGYMGDQMVMDTNDVELLKEIYVKQFSNFRNRKMAMQDNPSRSMLLNADDHQWKNIRSILSPAFSSGKLRHMTGPMVRCSETLCSHLKMSAGSEIDVREYMGAFTMDVIAAVAFGIDLDSQSDRNNVFVKHAKQSFDFNIARNPVIIPFVIFPTLAIFLNRMNILRIFPRSSINFFTSVVDNAMEARHSAEKGQKDMDFLQMMVNAGKKHDELEGQEVDEDIKSEHTEDRPSKKGLTHEEIVANGMIFMLAGYDTTAAGLTFTLYCLALNQDVQDKVREEVQSVMQGQDFNNNEVYPKMTYLDQVISESLRLYPPVLSSQRIAEEDCVLKGIPIKKDTRFMLSSFPLHRDEDAWPEPNKFDPERFTPEAKAQRDPFNYAPFGQGPRNCIGMRLALSELKIALAMILSQFRILRAADTQEPEKLIFQSSNLLKTEKTIKLKLEALE